MENENSSVELATELTVAWLSNPNTRAGAADVPAFMSAMKSALDLMVDGSGSTGGSAETEKREPAVSVRKSLASKDHIISMLDGKPYKTLKRHLSGHGMTPADYREAFGLKPDYPMVSETYSEARRAMAKKIGLGRKPGAKPAPKKTAVKKTDA